MVTQDGPKTNIFINPISLIISGIITGKYIAFRVPFAVWNLYLIHILLITILKNSAM